MKLVRKFMYPDPAGEQGGTPKAKEENPKSETKPEETDNVALAKALQEARANSVPKEEFEKLKEENKKLVSEIINGGGAGNGQDQTQEQQGSTVEELREKLYGPRCSELSNLEFWQYTLELREKEIKAGKPDPFLPIGSKISPTEDDAEKANNVAKVVQECIEQAEGNSEVFTALLQSRTNNDSPAMTMHLKKLGIKYK